MTNPLKFEFMERSVFIDTSAWIAFTSKTDCFHHALTEVFGDLAALAVTFVTSNDVLEETITRLAYDVSAKAAMRMYRLLSRAIEDGWLVQLWANEDIQAQAVKILAKYSDKKLSFTDAITAALMRREKIATILTLDSDFQFLGFQVLPALKR